MDPTLLQQAPPPAGLEAWITSNQALIQVVLWAGQLFFWIGMVVLVFYAVWQYKRWVNFQLGTGRSGQLRSGSTDVVADTATEDAPPVDQFVD